jgi:hypothetical protein
MINSCQSSQKKQKTNDDSNSYSNSNLNSDLNIIVNIKLIEKVAHAVIAKQIRSENKIIKQSCKQCVTNEWSCDVRFISLKCAYFAEIDRRRNLCEMNNLKFVNMKQILKKNKAKRLMNSKLELQINKLILKEMLIKMRSNRRRSRSNSSQRLRFNLSLLFSNLSRNRIFELQSRKHLQSSWTHSRQKHSFRNLNNCIYLRNYLSHQQILYRNDNIIYDDQKRAKKNQSTIII